MPPLPRPTILGIVNVTDDSFSDGGCYRTPAAAVAHAEALLAAGADVIDLGPASSAPEATPVTADEEIARLRPVVARLHAAGAALSIDTWQPATQRWAIGEGVALLNDIRGFPDPAVWPDLARADCRLIVMHSLTGGTRATRDAGDAATVVARIEHFFDDRIRALESAGVTRDRLILDPGMGLFLGTGPDPSLAVLRALPRLARRWDLPLLISVSRKGFLRDLTARPRDARTVASAAVELWAIQHGAACIRTHEPAALRDLLAVLAALDDA
ncbi:MAG: dihydropteroate synthase [bacterium]|nr:dihydropteroate synthase [bacterium]